MKIFITGASGYIGLAVAEAFARRGHCVHGLIRSKAKAPALQAREIVPVLGQMKRPDSYARHAQEAQVLIHCAAEYSTDYEALDRITLTALLALARKRASRALIYTSGVWLYGNTGAAAVDESSAFESAHLLPWRAAHEKRVLESSGPQLRGLVVRPGCVYGGRGGLTGYWFASAEKDGAASVSGDGSNRWAMVHVEDLADLYVRLAESGVRGELFNAADRSRYTVLESARSASRAAGASGKVRLLAPKDAEKKYGGLAKGMALDQHVDASKAVRILGWNPRFGGFAENAERHHAAWKAAQGA